MAKKIGIFSKFHVTGGSEMRCIEIANSLVQLTDCQSYLFCEGRINDKLRVLVDPRVQLLTNIFIPEPQDFEKLYDMDCLLVVNTDSQLFTKYEYWTGKSEKHSVTIDLTRIPQMIFLFNYVISPSKHLPDIEQYCPRIKIITTNTKFYREILRYENVIHFPRIILESPINPDVCLPKNPSRKIRFGMHSKPQGDKWNEQWPELIEYVNRVAGEDQVQWNFMGCPKEIAEKINKFNNVSTIKEFSKPVREFLQDLDVCIFFPAYKREEPWSRVVAEGLTSGCPVITTNKGGNVDQITHGNNGFLCDELEQFKKYATHLCDNRYILRQMQKISMKKSRAFSSEQIVNKLLDFIEW